MKVFWRFFFPPLFGFIIYMTIRVVVDSISGFDAWGRPWQTISAEIIGTAIIGLILDRILRWRLQKLENRQVIKLNIGTFFKEFVTVYFYCFLAINVTGIPLTEFTDNGMQKHDLIVLNVIPMLYILLYFAIARGNHYLQGYVENQLKLEKINSDRLDSELKFLKGQFHPHFLFNALNTIYFQMDESVPDAKKSVEKFSELLRYQLYDELQGKVLLEKEFQYLENYIDLQKTRHSKKLKLTKNFDHSLHKHQVYPFMLLPLVENAFKHIGGKKKISILAKKENNALNFVISNSKTSDTKDNKNKSGIGLDNVKRRLDLLYNTKANLEINDTADDFTAILKIDLDEN